MSRNLTFRLFNTDDIAGVMRLWEEESGWGGITQEQFYKWVFKTPFEDCLLVVAIDENGEIVGQEAFMPARVYASGVEKKALRVLAPILAKRFRERMSSAAHPSIGMYQAGLQEAVRRGYNVIYSFPAAGWLPFVKKIAPQIGIDLEKFITAEIDCYGFSLRDDANQGENSEVRILNEFSADFNQLWQTAVENFQFRTAIIRNQNWLNWKLGKFLVLEIRQNNDLIGFCAIKKETGLIGDAVARSPKDLEIVIRNTISYLSKNKDLLQTDEIKLMQTVYTTPIIKNLGFSRIDFKFAFWCYSPDESVSADGLRISSWYMMPND